MTLFDDVQDFFSKGIRFLQTYILPIAAVAVSCIPGVPPVAVGILNAIPKLMSAMEEALPESGNGPLRQQGVLAVIQAICDGMDANLKGGAKDTFIKIKPVAVAIMDNAIAFINAERPDIISAEPIKPIISQPDAG